MNIGILQVDSVLPQFQAAHGDYPDMFRGLLEAAAHANGQSLDVHNIDVLAGPLPEVDAFDAYVITGSKQSVYEDLPWLPPLVTFVGDAMAQQRPVIGICFGHQLLAHFFGGEVGPAVW